MTTVLVTGGAGFLGSHLVEGLLKQTDWNVVVWDKLTYAAEDGRLFEVVGALCNPRFSFYQMDLVTADYPHCTPEYIVHLAAETHVDRSILDPWPFIQSNIIGTYRMLEYARQQRTLKKFLYFSTDEVFGPAEEQPFSEWSRYNSSNPYSATKAAGEELALAWGNTHRLPVVISHCSNIFGEGQHEEKYIPKLVKSILGDKTVTIHADQNGDSGSRMYVYAGDVAQAIYLILKRGEIRQKYNIPGFEVSNEEMAYRVADILEKKVMCEKAYPFADRPGWDFRYSIVSKSLFELGWQPTPNFTDLLRQVVEHYAGSR